MGGVVDAVKDLGGLGTKLVGKGLEIVGGDILDDALGLNKIGREIEQAGKDIVQVADVMSGKYHDDAKKIKEQQERVESRIAEYNAGVDSLSEKIERLLAFEEIFKMAASNKLDSYIGQHGPEIDKLIAEYKAAVLRLKSEYDFVLSLTEGTVFEKLLGSIIMVMGGITSDLGDVLNGNADSDTWTRIVVAVVAIVMIVLAIPTGGASLTVLGALGILSSFLVLDTLYGGGAAMNGIMDVLDIVFNDLLKLDELIGNDFKKFDSDHKDFEEMKMYVQLALMLSQVYQAWTSPASAGTTVGSSSAGNTVASLSKASTEMTLEESMLNSAASKAALSSTDSYLGGALTVGQGGTGSLLGVNFSTYGQMYKAFSMAKDVNDVITANDQYEKLKSRLREDQLKVEEAISQKVSKNFTKSYKDTAYFLQDQQEFIDRYVWSMTSNSMYVDPYGTTPVANIRFTPDSSTRVTSFGFEDVFDESKKAGSREYFNNIIYGG